MSTPNFSFSNRCVLITNDDYEYGNCPKTTDEEIGSRSYPSWVVDCEGNDKMKFWRVVITEGYYADQCLDFVNIKPSACDIFNAWWYYDHSNASKTEIINDIHAEYRGKLTRKIIRDAFSSAKDAQDWKEMDWGFEFLLEKLAEQEKSVANSAVDRIKKEYGYNELACVGIFSNGEAIYEKI